MTFLICAGSAFADKPNHAGHGKHKKNEIESHSQLEKKSQKFNIPSNDKGKILSYLDRSHQKNCPPGLAKKNNGCLPPGQAKRYTVGQRLVVDSRSVPQKLLDILSPPPQGTFYRMVDSDVVLVSQRDQQIMDAVSLFTK